MALTRIQSAALQSSITASNIVDGSILPADLATTSDFTFNGVTVGRGPGAVVTNTVVGYNAMASNTTGSSNTAFGYNANTLNVTGTGNAAFGNAALSNNTGSNNTALGGGTLLSNTTGSTNLAVGINSLYSNTTGVNNVSVGSPAMRFNVFGSYNTAVGVNALRFSNSDNNTAVGFNAAYNTTIAVATLGTITAGSGYTNGTYNGVSTSTVSGATFNIYPTVNVTVSGGVVTAVTLVTGGYGASSAAGTVLTVTAAQIGGTGTGFSIPVATFATGQDNTAVGFASLFSNTVGVDNTAVGLYAMYGNTTANQNSAFGREALYSNTTGTTNVAIGRSALRANTTSDGNTAVGYQAGLANTTGASQTYVGAYAGYSNTTTGTNTAVGYKAGYTFNHTGAYGEVYIGYQAGMLTTGNYNTFVGGGSGMANTTGTANSALGAASLLSQTTGARNTALGSRSMSFTTTGTDNVAVGNNALITNTTGSSNVAVGNLSFQASTTVSNNTGVGNQTGYTNVLGINNTFIGFGAGYTSSAATGTGYNTAVGAYAGYALTTGVKNTFIGSFQSGGTAGSGSAITTGSANTIVGAYTGNGSSLDIRTSNNNIVLSDGDGVPRIYIPSSGEVLAGGLTAAVSGFGAGFQTTQAVICGRINIGNGVTAVDGNTIYLGSDSASASGWTVANGSYRFAQNRAGGLTSINPTGYTFEGGSGTGTRTFAVSSNGNVQNTNNSYGALSDVKLKENIVDASPKLEDLMKVKIRNFNLIADPDKTKQIGVVAQELEEVFPGMIHEQIDYTFEEVVDEHGIKDSKAIPTGTVTKEVKYSVFVPMLVKAIQEQQEIITELKARLDAAGL